MDESVDEKYKPLVEFVRDVGVEDAFVILDLEDGEKLEVSNKKGAGFFARGKGRLYICYLPEEALK